MRGSNAGWWKRCGIFSRRHTAVSRRGSTRGLVPVSRRRPKRALHHESLEPRLCLSASIGTGVDQLTSQLDWGGQSVTARADSWILRTDGALSSNFGGWLFDRSADTAWQSESLGEGFFSLTTPGATTEDVLGWASTTHGVAYVEPDFVINQASTPNDPDLSRLWGLHNTGQTGGVDDADIDALEAWNITTGSRDVVIAVIDTGVDYTHRDLAANAWQNPGEIPGNGVDDDGNGFVDDIYGYDFVNNDGDPMDDNGHGTHVAGTIGGVGNDGTGIVGVNWQVSIMGLKFLSGGGSGSTSDAVRAVNYATIMRRDHGINIVATNNSWGGGGFSQSLSDAIEGGGNAGILFIAAAGNEGNNNDTFPGYPASMTSEAIISVAATDSSNNLAGFSNYGATSVDVGAPGVGIYSALPGNRYASYSGTSMATPHVAGIVGLLAAANPNLTAAEIRTAILDTAVPISSLNGRVATGGLANAAAALDAISTGPSLRADIVNVAPDPRQDAVDTITIAFTSAVSGFDLADLALTRDGTAVALASTATLASSDQQTWTLGGLTTLTADLGVYQLTLTADGSGITNSDGLTLAADVTDSWLVVEPPPPAPFEPNDSIATAAPVALTAGRAAFSGIVGDGSYTLADVDLFSIELAAGATITLDVDARSLTPASTLDSYLRLFNASGRQLAYNDDTSGSASLDSLLAYTVSTAGTYYFGVSSYGNSSYDPVIAGSGRTGASSGSYELSVVVDTPTPILSGDIIDVSPDPRLDAVDAVTIAFSAAVTGFDLADLALTRDGNALSLADSGVTLTSSDSIRWTLADVTGLTGDPGDYGLVLAADGSGITSDEGASLTADITETWTVNPPPALSVDILDVSPDPRLDAVDQISITFNRAVNGVDLSDFILQRDGVDIPLTDPGDFNAAVALVTDDLITWTLADLASRTADPGTYELLLTAEGSFIADLDGEPLTTDASDTWRVLEPPPPAAFEPNDSIATAAALTLVDGQTRISAFVGDGSYERADVDLYAVNVTAAGTIILDVDARSLAEPSQLDSYLRLFDANGRQLAQNDDASGSLDSALAYDLQSSGTYYVGVSAYGNTRYNPFLEGSGRNGRSTGSYELFVRFQEDSTDPDPGPGPGPDPDPPAGPMEPNDSIDTATAVVFENRQAVIAGMIGDGAYGRSDVDLFAVELAAGTTIEIDVDARTLADFSALDSYLRLFDADGNELAQNDDAFGQLDSYLRYTVDARGTYYVGLSSYGNSDYEADTAGSGRRGRTVGDYVVTMSHDGPSDPGTDPGTPPPPMDPAEPNDSAATASLLTVVDGRVQANGTVGDGEYFGADVDLYVINLWAGSEIRLDIDARSLATPSTLDSYLRLFDATGRQLARNDDSRGSLDSQLSFTVQVTGSYFIGVSSYGNSRYDPAVDGSGRSGRTTGDYLLTVDVDAPDRPSTMTTMGFPDEAPPTHVVELLRSAAFATMGAGGNAGGRWTLDRVR